MAPSGSARNSTTVPAVVEPNVAVYALGRDSKKKVPVLPWLYVAIVTELCRQVLGCIRGNWWRWSGANLRCISCSQFVEKYIPIEV